MQPRAAMRMNKKGHVARSIDRFVRNLVRPAPTLARMRRRRTAITPYVVAGIGAAVASGIAALMLFSSRARSRVLGAAKETYGKVNQKIVHRREKGASNGGAEPVEAPVMGM